MANVFKNYTASSVGITEETVYNVPSATTSVVIGCNLANVHTAQIKVSVKAAPLGKGTSFTRNTFAALTDTFT